MGLTGTALPSYSFKVPLSVDALEFELKDDEEAWSQAVTYIGELLRDIDGGLPDQTEWHLTVHEGGRMVCEIDVRARRC